MTSAMHDKVVLVTGAGGGIGRAIALDMARAGAQVVVNDLGTSVHGAGHDLTPAQRVVNEIIQAGGRAIANGGSVADPGDAERMVADAMAAFGRLDAVVNNAGILRDRIFHKMSLEDWQSVINVHLNGCFLVSRAAASHFREQGHGAFVHMTSTSGLIGNYGQANYAAAKLGIAALSRSIALDMARFNVRSNCIAPFAATRMIDTIPTDDANQALRVRMMKALAPEKLGPMAVFLASDLAAGVSGQIFAVRGNEVFLMSQPRPLRGIHQDGGWTPDTLASHALPALRASMVPLETSRDVFPWEPL